MLQAGLGEAWFEAVQGDWRQADLDSRRLAVCRYVEKLTLSPRSMERSDVESLKAAGHSDRDVLEICEVAAYYAYVNRIADGLGVELEAK